MDSWLVLHVVDEAPRQDAHSFGRASATGRVHDVRTLVFTPSSSSSSSSSSSISSRRRRLAPIRQRLAHQFVNNEWLTVAVGDWLAVTTSRTARWRLTATSWAEGRKRRFLLQRRRSRQQRGPEGRRRVGRRRRTRCNCNCNCRMRMRMRMRRRCCCIGLTPIFITPIHDVVDGHYPQARHNRPPPPSGFCFRVLHR